MSHPLAAEPSAAQPQAARKPSARVGSQIERRRPFRHREALSSWATSLLFHATLIVLLGLVVAEVRPEGDGIETLATRIDAGEPVDALDPMQPSDAISSETVIAVADAALEAIGSSNAAALPPAAALDFAPDLNANSPDLFAGVGDVPVGELLRRTDPSAGGGLTARTPEGRAEYGPARGATRPSEDAVERGLNWLAAHQLQDGSWTFDFVAGPCNGLCRDSGSLESPTAATSLALLPFLGAGYTHMSGKHQETVRRGLYYLMSQIEMTPQGADLQGGARMYGQGLATLVFCEAFAMTEDQALAEPAQRCLDFVVYAQDASGGGWRYSPGTPGDTTVTGWQLMALKSGRLAKLAVPTITFTEAAKFLNSVQDDGGASYNYMGKHGQTQATTAVGLLGRMYTGWDREQQGLQRGINKLLKWGPSRNDMYYNYYAALVLNHASGNAWAKWNEELRDYLVETQATEGHENGSWHFPERHAMVGGRLYTTSICVLTLEVYYRYLPLYGDEALEVDE